MPDIELTNALNEESEAFIGLSQRVVEVVNGDVVVLTVGTLVEIVTPFTGATTLQVVRSQLAADNLLLGVVVGGNYPSGPAAVGGIAQVCVSGFCQINCDATTTAGTPLIQSAATRGAGKTGAAVLAQTIGVALQAVTVSSGTLPVWAYITRM